MNLTFCRLSDVPFQKYMRYSVWKLFIRENNSETQLVLLVLKIKSFYIEEAMQIVV